MTALIIDFYVSLDLYNLKQQQNLTMFIIGRVNYSWIRWPAKNLICLELTHLFPAV